MGILRLKETLKEKGVTGKELSEKVGITETSLSRIIKGDQQPRFDLLLKIAEALDVDVKDLFNSTKTNKHPKEELQDIINQLENLKGKL